MDGAYTLVNPFSMSTTMLLPRWSTDVIGDPPPFMKKLVVCSPNLVAAAVGAGCQKLALCRPGAASWVVVAHDQLESLQDMIWYRGKLYALHGDHGSLLCISVGEDRDTGEPTVSRIDILVEGPSTWDFTEPPLQYLLESDGALLMVRREDPNIQTPFMGDDYGVSHYVGLGLEKATEFKVFEADLARSRWTELSSMGEDRVLFVQSWCSRAVRVPDRCRDYITGDRIFFVSDAAARGYNCTYYRKNVSFYCSIYDMKKQRSQTYLRAKVRPLKGFPVAWLFRGSEPACVNK
jgi:hypothetical protein